MVHPLVKAQIQGDELPKQTIKIEFQLRTKTGAIASSFDDETLVQPYLDLREAKWGDAAPKLILFRVTTICEQI